MIVELKAFSLAWLLSQLLFNIALELLAIAARAEKVIKLSLLGGKMVVYSENPKESLDKLLELIGKFSRLLDTS